MIWAEKTSTPDITFHSSYGFSKITLLSSGGSDVKNEDIETIVLIHGLVLWSVWTVFSLVMLVTNRWFVDYSDKS
jgi:hypothetical protein